MQALLANSIQLSQNSASAAIGAALRGAPIALVSTSENRMSAEIVARSEIKTPQQLIGKKIGILRFGGSNDTAIQWALRAWKIDPRQVTIILWRYQFSTFGPELGTDDATILSSYPEILLRSTRLNVLADSAIRAYPNRRYAHTRVHRKAASAVKNYCGAQIERFDYIRTIGRQHQNSQEILRVDEPIDRCHLEFFAHDRCRTARQFGRMKNILREMQRAPAHPPDFSCDISLPL